jgi:hypothetical protein
VATLLFALGSGAGTRKPLRSYCASAGARLWATEGVKARLAPSARLLARAGATKIVKFCRITLHGSRWRLRRGAGTQAVRPQCFHRRNFRARWLQLSSAAASTINPVGVFYTGLRIQPNGRRFMIKILRLARYGTEIAAPVLT